MLDIIPIPALKDNYIWLVANRVNSQCFIIDPGDAEPVLSTLRELGLTLNAILITHHHYDHTNGIKDLCDEFSGLAVYGPRHEKISCITNPVAEGDLVTLSKLDCTFEVIDIPGHTSGHIAYFGEGMLFCGDTLFAAGCGRLFEGTAEQMYVSLAKIAALPDSTAIFCAHEYTQANLRFASTVEPDNKDIQARIIEVDAMRARQKPTLPSNLAIEKLTNPFLRCKINSVINSLKTQFDKNLTDPVAVFQMLRAWKDTF
jgi:hydroxyacylglutathione hydrolase